MGRKRQIISFAAIFALLPLGASIFETAESQVTAHAAPAKIAQTTPVISREAPPARDAQTFAEDLSITNACVDQGATKSECLCVTRILKHELSLMDYKTTARLYQSPKDSQQAKAVSTRLINDPDFAMRCANATAYFDAGRKASR